MACIMVYKSVNLMNNTVGSYQFLLYMCKFMSSIIRLVVVIVISVVGGCPIVQTPKNKEDNGRDIETDEKAIVSSDEVEFFHWVERSFMRQFIAGEEKA